MWQRASMAGGGSGQMVETVLWTNPNPSASTGFAAQSASLSDDINNYEWIAVEYGRMHNALTDKNKVYWKVSDFKTFISTANRKCGGLTLVNNIRTFYYDNDTQAHFGANLSGGTATNTLNIPLYIYGCNIE